jgi:hypothetical protein
MELLKGNRTAISGARSYRALAEVALMDLRQLSEPVAMVCGPIKSGGALLRKGCDPAEAKKSNRAKLNGVISFLSRERAIFNQLPFLDRAEELRTGKRLRRKWTGKSVRDYVLSLFSRDGGKRESTSDRDRLRNEFHLPILASGLIGTIYFLDGWKDSVGSRWYHAQAKELGVEIRYVIPILKKPVAKR